MLHRLGLTLDHLTHDAFEMVYTRSYLNELFVCSAGSTGITTLLTSVLKQKIAALTYTGILCTFGK